ncbi:MAG: hypothetical protein ACM359_22485 [Bacillota bacterium]
MASRRFCHLAILLACLVAGCAHSTASKHVPSDAWAITTKTGPIGFIAPAKGTVYILDVKADRLVYTRPVQFRDELLFDPQSKQILLNRTVIGQADSNTNRSYRLYFQKG